MNTPVFKIRNDLIEAYKGYYEDDREATSAYIEYVKDATNKNFMAEVKSLNEWLTEWVQQKILTDQPAERLERYCEWNGILGYSTTLFDIATGKLS